MPAGKRKKSPAPETREGIARSAKAAKTRARARAPEPKIAMAAALVRMREEGWTFREIAAECGYGTPQSAYRAWKEAIESDARQSVEDARTVAFGRLEFAIRKVMTRLAQDDPFAAADLVKLIDRQSKLIGMDSKVEAKKVEVKTGRIKIVRR